MSEQQILTIEEFNQLLQLWSGKTVKVTKNELRDEDTIIMNIEEISYSTDTRRIDEYEPMHSLYLHGRGRLATEPQNAQPLPSPYYEIPLEDSTQYQFQNEKFSLLTDRGSYTIELMD
ncbi:hypothetical protein [Halobacillus litoralis]|uniref:Uncharacterized protein n=1 Tax=Halobacillus litoralis TaxID=45668 RepID=A0A410ME32_9BACI|nr:hypothetical protein [Halobacillus litoralis]QAS52999.1 hypothetical protein HLI_12755 [Halobacillus litoralis]